MSSLQNFVENLHLGLLGNPWERWAMSAFVTGGVLILAYFLKNLLGTKLKHQAIRTETKWDDAALKALEKTQFLFILLFAIHFGTQGLDLPVKLEKAREAFFFLFLFYQIGLWLSTALKFIGQNSVRASLAREPGKATTISTLLIVGDIFIWVTMGLLLLANFKVDISALVAGLGIGGVAVAFALQNILGDLFASFSIVLDKPFVIGDSINVNGFSGTVEQIGLKTTRIRSVDGEQLIFSNSDLLKNVVKNFKRMERRRAIFSFGLIYETPPEKLDRARELVREVIGQQKYASFDRCHLARFAASSLDFDVAYWMETSDYSQYVETQHRISVDLLRAFAREGLEFAYPTQVSIPKAGLNA